MHVGGGHTGRGTSNLQDPAGLGPAGLAGERNFMFDSQAGMQASTHTRSNTLLGLGIATPPLVLQGSQAR